jgi:hypothetical protein
MGSPACTGVASSAATLEEEELDDDLALTGSLGAWAEEDELELESDLAGAAAMGSSNTAS